MLITPDNLLFLHLLDDDLYNELLHHLSQELLDAGVQLSPLREEEIV